MKIGTQHNHQTTAIGYASSVLAPLHFGLAGTASVPQIEIHYPNGQTKLLTNVPANRIVKP